jgi:3-phosphoshikimate 1-carboxyvinyltransferase
MGSMSYLDLKRAVQARGVVRLPGSKSISNRLLLLAALAEGETEILDVLDSDDTRVMLAALRILGVEVVEQGDNRVRVQGTPLGFPNRSAQLFLGNAGTAMRSLTAVLALMAGETAGRAQKDFSLYGVPRMHERPIGDLVEALNALGATVSYLEQPGHPPLHIGPANLRPGQVVALSGRVSSQFLTALLLAAPIYTRASATPLVIEIVGELISKPYVEITLQLMARYGVVVGREVWSRFTVPAGATYRSPGCITVEGDASSASYLLALGLLGGGPVRVVGVGQESIQGDVAFTQTLQAMGATIAMGADWIESRGIQVAYGQKLAAFDTDFNAIPDAAMTAATLALFADGPCRLRNIGSWRVKETDRIQAMAAELTKLGATVVAGVDCLEITPPSPEAWHDAHICTWEDHRMAMSLSLAAFGPARVRILNPACVSKTFPHYFDVYQALIGDEEIA